MDALETTTTDSADKTAEKRAPNRRRLTKSLVNAIEAPETGYRVVWDADLAGFGVRVMASGVRSYFLQRRTKSSRGVKVTIGRCDRVTTEQARQRARQLVAQLELGKDPIADLQAARAVERARRAEQTVADLWRTWLTDHASRHKRTSSIASDKSLWAAHLKPALGSKRISQVTREHLEDLHRKITGAGTPTAANRAIMLAKTLFNFAVERKLRLDNPAQGVKMNGEDRRETYLRNGQLKALTAVLERRGDLPAKLITFLLLTGARRGETLSMRWQDVDLESGVWSKPSAHTKQKRVHHLPLSAEARELLQGLPRRGDRVFGGIDRWHVRRAWRAICKEAGLAGVRLHDLRHSHASILASSGFSLPVIGALLGHTQAGTTMRYAHLVDETLKEAVDRAGEAIRTGQVVIPFPKRVAESSPQPENKRAASD